MKTRAKIILAALAVVLLTSTILWAQGDLTLEVLANIVQELRLGQVGLAQRADTTDDRLATVEARAPTFTPTTTPIIVTLSPGITISTRAPTFTPTITPIPTDTPDPTDTPIPTDTPPPTDTPAPTDTPVPTETPTPRAASFTVNRDAVNVRAGPGTNYAILGTVRRGETYTPNGRLASGEWLRFTFEGKQGWVYTSLMIVDRADLIRTVTAPPPTPAPPTKTPAPPSTNTPLPAGADLGISIAAENRCAPYNSDDYSYPQSVEPQIINRMGGRIYSPYTGAYFGSRGETDIEHVVARSEAHDSGLCAASLQIRRNFARDLDNLTLADPHTNRQLKVAKDLAEWLPDLNRCWYVNQVLIVKRKYGLTMDQAEANTARAVLASCSSTNMIFADGSAPAPTNTPPPPSGGNENVDALAMYDDNGNGRITCAEARNHGIAPVPRGHPAYRYMNDRDNDGVVCE